MNYKKYIPLFILLIFLAFVPRSVEVFNKNFLFGFDQGRDYLAVKDIVVNHKFTLIGSEIGAGSAGFRGIFHGPFYYYFLSVPFLIFHGDPYGGILLMFLIGLSAIFFSYFLGRKLFGEIGGVVLALLVAISPPLISQSRFIWNSHPSTLFILLVFYFVYRFIKYKKKKDLFWAAFFSGFIYNFELAIAVPMSLALVAYFLLIIRLKIKEYLLLIPAFVLAFFPMLMFEARHNFMAINGFLNYSLHNQSTPLTLRFIQLITRDHIVSFWYNFLSSFPRQNIIPQAIVLLVVFIPVFFYLRSEKNTELKKFIYYLLLLIPINLIAFFALRNAVYTYYLIDLNLVYIFLFSYSIFMAFKRKNNFLKLFLSLFLAILIVMSIKDYSVNFKNDYYDYGGTAKIKGRIDAIDYIYKDAKNQKFGLLIFSPPIYTYPYDYLLWWHGKEKYGFVPTSEKKGVFYLLIEPDAEKLWSYKGWLETVVKTGKIIETKKLPSGFIIQKRIEEKNAI